LRDTKHVKDRRASNYKRMLGDL